jgi:hexosaminidase
MTRRRFRSDWLRRGPGARLRNQDGSLNPTALDLTNPEAVEWALGLITEHIDLFSGDEWHLGSDEFPGWPGTGENHPQLDAYAKERFGPEATFADLFADFQNRANELVKSHGKTMRVWNDMVRESQVVQLDADVTVEYWIQHPDLPGLLSGADLAERGNPLINAHIDHLYYDQSRRNLDPRHVYENFDVDVIHWETPVPAEAVRGARLPVWLAWIYTPMESDAEVLNNIVPSMAALAQVTWGSPKLVDTWTGFVSDVLPLIGAAPGLNAESDNSIQPGPVAARNVDGTVAYFARDAEGSLWTGKQSRPTITISTKR